MNHWTIQFDKKENIILKLFRILGLIGSFVYIILSILNHIQSNLWILPLTYSLGMILLGNHNAVKFTPGIIALNIVMFCRYLVLPIVMIVGDDEISNYAIQYGQIEFAVLIMWFELIGILVAIYFTGKRLKRVQLQESSADSSVYFVELKYGGLVSLISIILLIAMAIRYPHLVGGLELLTQGYISESVDISEVSGIVGIIWKAFVTWLGVYFLYVLKKKKFQGIKLTFFLIFCVFSVVLISFIGQITISRWYSVVTFGAMYFSVIKMFPNKKKIITTWSVIPAIALLCIVSLYKNTDYLRGDGQMLDYIKDLIDAPTLNAYLAGPISVNNAVYLKEQISFGITSLFYDIFRNFPVLNHYIAVEKSTVGMYAAYLGRGDQILPLVGQSVIYFGYILTPLFSIISVILVRHFDYRYLKSSSLSMYMYAFIAVWLGIVTILNFTVCMSWFYCIIIPTFLLLQFVELLGAREVKDDLFRE